MKIQLPDFILADLYKNTLVVINELPTEPIKKQASKGTKKGAAIIANIDEPSQKKWYLGNNLKHVTILVQDENNVYLNDDLLQLLTSILAACKLTLADVAIINNANNAISYQQLKQSLQPTCCFLFNVTTDAIQLSFTIPQYQVQQYDNCTFLLAPDLSLMNGSTPAARAEKTKLWVCLKKIFNM